jgi:hypothetical protein
MSAIWPRTTGDAAPIPARSMTRESPARPLAGDMRGRYHDPCGLAVAEDRVAVGVHVVGHDHSGAELAQQNGRGGEER